MRENNSKLIYIIEDDKTMRSLLRTLLELEGFSTDVFFDIEKDLLIMKIIENNPSIILLDINLKCFNGLDLLKEIRKTKIIKDKCVIISSGQYYEDEALKAGASYYLLKPYMPNDLIKLIKQNIEGAF